MSQTLKNSVAFLYPGLGSQHKGMGQYLYDHFPETRVTFKTADQQLGFSLSSLCFEGPQDELDQDLNSQLAAYLVNCVTTDVLKARGASPDMASGYSSGFYGAAYAAGCFDFSDGLEIVKSAGEILLDEGRKTKAGMAVIFGLSLDQVKSICRQAGEVWIAIQNTPKQTVISGTVNALKKAIKAAIQQKALDAYFLPLALGYHSLLVRGSGKRFLDEVRDEILRAPRIPLFSYLSLESVKDAGDLKETMAFQLYQPVFWVDLVKMMGACSSLMIEVGAGRVISRTVIWIDRKIEILNTNDEKNLEKTMERYILLKDSHKNV